MLSNAQAPRGLSRIPWIGAEVALLGVHLRDPTQKAMQMYAWSLKTRRIGCAPSTRSACSITAVHNEDRGPECP